MTVYSNDPSDSFMASVPSSSSETPDDNSTVSEVHSRPVHRSLLRWTDRNRRLHWLPLLSSLVVPLLLRVIPRPARRFPCTTITAMIRKRQVRVGKRRLKLPRGLGARKRSENWDELNTNGVEREPNPTPPYKSWFNQSILGTTNPPTTA